MGRRRLLVPEARAAMQQLKVEAIDAVHGRTHHEKQQQETRVVPAPERQAQTDGGALTTSEAGRIGGPIGGEMVRKMVALAKAELTDHDAHKLT